MRNWGVVHTVGAEAGIDRSRVIIILGQAQGRFGRIFSRIKIDQNCSINQIDLIIHSCTRDYLKI